MDERADACDLRFAALRELQSSPLDTDGWFLDAHVRNRSARTVRASCLGMGPP
jgi:hypothetical protein